MSIRAIQLFLGLVTAACLLMPAANSFAQPSAKQEIAEETKEFVSPEKLYTIRIPASWKVLVNTSAGLTERDSIVETGAPRSRRAVTIETFRFMHESASSAEELMERYARALVPISVQTKVSGQGWTGVQQEFRGGPTGPNDNLIMRVIMIEKRFVKIQVNGTGAFSVREREFFTKLFSTFEAVPPSPE